MMRRAAFVLWAAVALSRAASGQCQPGQAQAPVLTPGVATQGHIEPGAQAVLALCDSPGDAVLIRLLSLSQDYSLRFTMSWSETTTFPLLIYPRCYPPSPTPSCPAGSIPSPGTVGATFTTKGVALEWMIALCNRLECAPWFCLPHLPPSRRFGPNGFATPGQSSSRFWERPF